MPDECQTHTGYSRLSFSVRGPRFYPGDDFLPPRKTFVELDTFGEPIVLSNRVGEPKLLSEISLVRRNYESELSNATCTTAVRSYSNDSVARESNDSVNSTPAFTSKRSISSTDGIRNTIQRRKLTEYKDNPIKYRQRSDTLLVHRVFSPFRDS